MDQVLRAPRGHSQADDSGRTTSGLTASTSSNNLSALALHGSSASSLAAQSVYHHLAQTASYQHPQLAAQNRKRAAAERAAIQQKIKNHVSKTQLEMKKQKELQEKTKIWEEQVLPHWKDYQGTTKLKDLCMRGIPTNLRSKVWPRLVGNALQVRLGMVW